MPQSVSLLALLASLLIVPATALCESTSPPASAPTAGQEEEGFVPLFDGESLDGWIGATDAYTTEEGCIVSLPDKSGNLYTAGQYANFILRFEFQLDPGANNGIGLRVPYGGRASYDGFEIQILDDEAERYAKLNPYQFCGSVYGIIPAKKGALKPAGEWNEQEIVLDGRDIRITLNGTVIVDGNLDEASTPQTLDGKDHPGLKQTTGHLSLCGHKSRVRFRNLRVKTLPDLE